MPYDQYGEWYSGEIPKTNKFNKGDTIYVVSFNNTIDNLGGCIVRALLGESVQIKSKKYYPWMADSTTSGWTYKIEASFGIYDVHEADLDTENTYEEPSPPPDYLKESWHLPRPYGRNYRCFYLLITPRSSDYYMKFNSLGRKYDWLDKRLKDPPNYPCNDSSYDPYCRTCPGGNDCKRLFAWEAKCKTRDTMDRFMVVRNTNHACWADLRDLLIDFWEGYGEWPTNLWARFRQRDLDYDLDNEVFSWRDVVKFYNYMKEGRVLPRGLKTPRIQDRNRPIYFDLDITKTGINRLFWYLNVLRDPSEHPKIAKRAVHFIEKGKMEPLMAYVMANICCPSFNGGHAVVGNCDFARDYTYGTNDTPMPRTDTLIPYVVRVHRMLTQKVEPYIHDCYADSLEHWNLHEFTTREIKYRKKPEIPTVSTIHKFSVKERKLLREDKNDIQSS